MEKIDDSCQLTEYINKWKISSKNRNALITSLRHFSMGKSIPLFLQDEKVHSLHFICSGKIKQVKINYSGKNAIIKVYGPGNFVDISSAFSESNYSFSSYTLEESCLHVFNKELFLRVFREEIQFQEMVLKQLCEDELDYKNELSNCRGLPGRQNLASLLITLSRDFGTKTDKNEVVLDIQLSRAELAELCGMTTEGLIRHLANLKKEGIVADSAGKKIFIRDLARLKEIIRN